jgi:hypothetical protein
MDSLPVEAVLPAIIGAIATVTAALIQLVIGWRKEMAARDGHTPVITKRTRRGMIAAVFVLMIASAVGGFSLSQYLVGEAQKEAQELDRETRARLEQLSAIAERLERSTLAAQKGEAPTARAAENRPENALPQPTCLEGNPPVEKPCAETGSPLPSDTPLTATAVTAPK